MYDVTEFLTPAMYSLVQGLQLVDTRAGKILCMGKCVNGGKCTKPVNKDDLVRGLMGLSLLVLTGPGEFEQKIRQICKRFLCLSNHRKEDQITRFCEEARNVINRFRDQQSTSVTLALNNTSGSCAGQASASMQITTGADIVVPQGSLDQGKMAKQDLHAAKPNSGVFELKGALEMLKGKHEKLKRDSKTLKHRNNELKSALAEQAEVKQQLNVAQKTMVDLELATLKLKLENFSLKAEVGVMSKDKQAKVRNQLGAKADKEKTTSRNDSSHGSNVDSNKTTTKNKQKRPYGSSIIKREKDENAPAASHRQVYGIGEASSSKSKEREDAAPFDFFVRRHDPVKYKSESEDEEEADVGDEDEGGESDDQSWTFTPAASEVSADDFASYQDGLLHAEDGGLEHDGDEDNDEVVSDCDGHSMPPPRRVTRSCTVL